MNNVFIEVMKLLHGFIIINLSDRWRSCTIRS